MSCPYRFGRDKSGNFAMLSSILALPLVMGAGVALDYSAMSRTKSSLQQAMDSAALAIAREGTTITNAQAVAIADEFLQENFDPDFTNLAVDRNGTSVSVKALTMAPLAFGSLFGYEKWPVNAASAADIAYAHYEIALVLDTTGSMKGGKLTSMKDAAAGLIETMSKQVSNPDRLKFSVVPFANFVNVGPEYGPKFDSEGKVIPGSAATWLDVYGKAPIPQSELEAGVSRFEIFKNLNQTWAGCVETRVATGTKAHDADDTPAVAADKLSMFVPAFSIDEPAEPGYANDYIVSDAEPLNDSDAEQRKKLGKYGIAPNLIDTLVGILGGGDDDDDDDDDSGSGGGGVKGWEPVSADLSGGKGPNNGCVTQPLMPLTNNYAALTSKVNSLQASGTTNIMEGVAWGMRILSPGEPFAQASDPAKTKFVEKIMIVLTDGANVFGNNSTELGSSYGSRGYLADGRLGIDAGGANDTNELMNERTVAACTNAKKLGIELYTIRLEEPDVETGTMLAECASDPGHYFDAPSRTQLDDIFQIIRDRVVRVRLSS